ncbi:MAG: hypothetical protein QGD94_04830 [Planctomycetia bacterium]|nr:hypothetical protein [Planctomycetia bacterium]
MKTFTRIVAAVVVASILFVIAGCQSEYKTHRKIEIDDTIIKQDTIVE